MKVVLGIDPGQAGGIAALSGCGTLMVRAMPPIDSDWSWFRWYTANFECTAYIEKVHSMPKQGVASTFKFGTGYGFVRGLLAGMFVPATLVTPQAWQKVMLAGENKQDKKAASIAVAARTWPGYSFLATERCRKPHDGMAEAALIAEYGRRMNA